MPAQAAPTATDPLQSGGTAAARANSALTHFRERFGADATHLVHAPGRVNLIGEHTDYNGGFVLPLAIELGVQIAARPNDRRIARLWSAQLGGSVVEISVENPVQRGLPEWSNYVRGVLAGLQGEGRGGPGLRCGDRRDACRAGGGLSSSAALEVATATLVETLAGVTLDPVRKALHLPEGRARFRRHAVRDHGSVRGHLWQTRASAAARLPVARTRELVPMRDATASLLVINTMVKHELTDGGYASRRDDCHEAARILGVKELRDATPQLVEQGQPVLTDRLFRRARHVVLGKRAHARRGRRAATRRVGGTRRADVRQPRFAARRLRSELRGTRCRSSTPRKTSGVAGGVFGCRMTGGGFGGCCVALVQAQRAEEVAAAIRARYHEATGIEPTIFATQPADGPAVLLKP